jgi:hypothetical protein
LADRPPGFEFEGFDWVIRFVSVAASLGVLLGGWLSAGPIANMRTGSLG